MGQHDRRRTSQERSTYRGSPWRDPWNESGSTRCPGSLPERNHGTEECLPVDLTISPWKRVALYAACNGLAPAPLLDPSTQAPPTTSHLVRNSSSTTTERERTASSATSASGSNQPNHPETSSTNSATTPSVECPCPACTPTDVFLKFECSLPSTVREHLKDDALTRAAERLLHNLDRCGVRDAELSIRRRWLEIHQAIIERLVDIGYGAIAGSLTQYGGTDRLPFHFWEGLVVTDAKTHYGTLFRSFLRELHRLHLAEGAAYTTLGQFFRNLRDNTNLPGYQYPDVTWNRSTDAHPEAEPTGAGLLRLTLTRSNGIWSACGGEFMSREVRPAPDLNTNSLRRAALDLQRAPGTDGFMDSRTPGRTTATTATTVVPTNRPASAYHPAGHFVASDTGLPRPQTAPGTSQPTKNPTRHEQTAAKENGIRDPPMGKTPTKRKRRRGGIRLSLAKYTEILGTLTSVLSLLKGADSAPNDAHGHLTIFEDMGQMVTDTSYIHVISTVNLNDFTELFGNARTLLLQDQAQTYNSTAYSDELWYKAYTRALHELFFVPSSVNSTTSYQAGISIAHRLARVTERFHDILKILPPTARTPSIQSPFTPDTYHDSAPNVVNSGRKTKRSPVIPLVAKNILKWGLKGGAHAIILGTMFGLMSATQVSEIEQLKANELIINLENIEQQMFANLNSRLVRALQVIRHNNLQGGVQMRWQIWDTLIQQLEARLHQFQSLIESLQMHRISLDWFTPGQLADINAKVQDQARIAKLTPLVDQLSDYLQLEVSYARVQGDLHIYIHVPVSSEDSLWSVYRYLPFPIPQPDQQLGLVVTNEDIIAVGPKPRYKVMSVAQFEKCHRRYNRMICDQPLVAGTNMSNTCVGALMEHHSSAITQLCTINVVPDREMVFQISAQTFAIHSPVTFTAHGVCWDQRRLTFMIGSSSQVNIPKGCTLDLRQHEIKLPLAINPIQSPWVMPSEWDVTKVAKDLLLLKWEERINVESLLTDNDQDDQRFQSLLQAAGNESAILHQRIHQRIIKAQSLQSFFSYGLLMFCLVLTIAVGTFCFCRYCNPRSINRTSFDYPLPRPRSPILRAQGAYARALPEATPLAAA